jgi:predicted GH43/DUF377 family glycosyl hydrolase
MQPNFYDLFRALGRLARQIEAGTRSIQHRYGRVIRSIKRAPMAQVHWSRARNQRSDPIFCDGPAGTGCQNGGTYPATYAPIWRDNRIKQSWWRFTMKGVIASCFSVLVMACSGCGGGGGGGSDTAATSPTPVTQAPPPPPIPQPKMQIVTMEPAPVMGRGAPGTWDDTDALNPSVIEFQGKLLNYYSGYNGTTWQTGLASSTDNGLTWTKLPAPVIGLGQWTTNYIAANGSSIVVNGQMYHYFQGKGAAENQQIGLAISNDGQSFNMLPTPVLPIGAPGSVDAENTADPYVIKVGAEYWMYYFAVSRVANPTPNKIYNFNIALATSKDGMTWQKNPTPMLGTGAPGDFDSDAVGEPAVIYAAPFYYMLYVGTNSVTQRNIGWAVSSDGIKWTKKGALIPDSMRQSWDSQAIADPSIMATGNNDGTYYVWFGGGNQRQGDQNLNGQIGRFTIKLN